MNGRVRGWLVGVMVLLAVVALGLIVYAEVFERARAEVVS